MTVLNLPDPPKRPGRPPRPEPPPGPTAQEAEARRLEVLDELVADDEIVVSAGADDPHLVDRTIRELAIEVAHLGFLARRARARRTAKASQLAGQRIRSLTRIAGLVLSKARSGFHLSEEPPDEVVSRVRELFLAEVLRVGEDTVGPVLSAELMRRVLAKLDAGANGVRHEGEGEVEVQRRIPVDSGLGPA